MDLTPVAITHPNWPAYDQACRDGVGYAPIKEIDGSQFNLQDPAAYLATLDFSDPLRTLRAGSLPQFSHFHVTFAGVIANHDCIHLASETDLTITATELKRNQVFILITGSANQWRRFVLEHARKESDLRSLAGKVYTRFKQVGLRELFDGYSSETLSDGTIILK